MSEAQRLSSAVEAILFSSNRPLKVRELQQATEADRPAIEAALETLRESLTHRGLMLQRHQDQVHLATRPEVVPGRDYLPLHVLTDEGPRFEAEVAAIGLRILPQHLEVAEQPLR